ncbi:MAG: filamentous hemagglutinin N-terminal domain-containing protein, partial [Cyanobacteria bacterium P01_G01_bin.67]
MKPCQLLFFTPSLLLFIPSLVEAQVLEDNTLSTEVNTENNRDFTVEAGEQRGSNLFHSFQEFSVPNNGSVFFDNAVKIQNIITRVTGSSISEINGLIRSNGTANLFLLNPNGIIFGENARLNIGGSFIGTTAESLVFEDGTEFSTNPDNSEPLLTVNVPLGLQFGSNSGEIINRANSSIPNPLDPTGQDQIKLGLTTAPGKTLALLGDGITFDGGAVTSPIGNIELGSVAENSFVTLEPVTQGWQANYTDGIQFRDLVFDDLASVDASGIGGGDIRVNGRNIRILNGSAITSNTLGDLDGGTISVQASDLVEINGSDITGTKLDPFLAQFEIFLPFASQISSNTFGAGKGGDINIIAQNLQIIDGGSIELQTFSSISGKGGDLSIVADKSIELNGARPFLGVGKNASNLIVTTIPLETAIEINQVSEISNVSISNSSAGDINLVAHNIRLEDGAIIQTSPFDSGNGGNIDIKVFESLEVLGTSPRKGILGSTVGANSFAEGNSGNINIDTNKLSLQDGGRILSVTNSSGNAGVVNIDSSVTEVQGISSRQEVPSLISTQATGGGDGGDISINTDTFVISDRASLSVQGTGESVPGNLNVNADFVELRNGANISATTEFQSGGNITLDIAENLTLKENSLISAQAINAADGGNLDIDANFVIAFPQQNNDILASAVSGD